MRKYEALIVLNMKGSATLDELTAAMTEKLEAAGAKVTGTRMWVVVNSLMSLTT